MTQKSKPTFDIELSLKNQGYKYIVGVDEAGRGPLMGPVVAAAVFIPEGFDTSELNDSKKISKKKREKLFLKIAYSCDCAIEIIDNNVIDAINILESTKLAMRGSINKIKKADYAIIDGNFIPDYLDIPAKAVIGGDSLSASVAAASIIAKVSRDDMIKKMHQQWPVYNWIKNQGYGTLEHREAIKKYGITFLHRKTFGGVKEYV